MRKSEMDKLEKISARIAGGEIIEQKSWKMIRELNSYSEESLDATALINGERSFSYRQMFRMWDRYAEVFSALGITEKNKSRVGISAGAVLETVNAFYALNMMGVSVSMLDELFTNDDEKCRLAIEKEGITDIIVTDEYIGAPVFERLLRKKEECGIKHVIYIHPPVCGPISTPAMRSSDELALKQKKKVEGLLFMDELLNKYDAYPIASGSGKQDEAAVILHTSGTTSGIPKPVPLSDRSLNEAAVRILKMEEYSNMRGRVTLPLIMPPAASYCMVDCIHLPLVFGGTIVSVAKFHMNPLSFRSVEHYGINALFMPAMFVDLMMKLGVRPNLSGVELAIIGGAYVSPDKKKRFDEFMKQCGSKAKITVGYGLSEVGAACFLTHPDNESDSMGFPLPGIKVRLYSESEDKYYGIEDGGRTGVLFVSSPSISGGRIGDTVFFTLDEIDGEKYFNTNDVVRANEDGSLTFVGRANRFFVNNDGIRFDAGLVETAFAAQPGIAACGLVPAYSKTMHDTVPVLYVQTDDDSKAVHTVRTALIKVFITDNNFEKSNLPSQCVICRQLPLNANGKVDVCRIRDEGLKGEKFKVEPVRKNDKLIDVILKPVDDRMQAGMPGELDPFGTPVEVKNQYRLDNIVNGFMKDHSGRKDGRHRPFPDLGRPFGKDGENESPFDPAEQFGEFMKNMAERFMKMNDRMNENGCRGPKPPKTPENFASFTPPFFTQGNEDFAPYMPPFFGQSGENGPKFTPPFFGQSNENCQRFTPPFFGQGEGNFTPYMPPFFGQKKDEEPGSDSSEKPDCPGYRMPFMPPVAFIPVIPVMPIPMTPFMPPKRPPVRRFRKIGMRGFRRRPEPCGKNNCRPNMPDIPPEMMKQFADMIRFMHSFLDNGMSGKMTY